jgi:hypothetical protein
VSKWTIGLIDGQSLPGVFDDPRLRKAKTPKNRRKEKYRRVCGNYRLDKKKEGKKKRK